MRSKSNRKNCKNFRAIMDTELCIYMYAIELLLSLVIKAQVIEITVMITIIVVAVTLYYYE